MTEDPGTGPAPLAIGRASGKIILFGEHFVVHGGPALALPFTAVSTTVQVFEEEGLGRPRLESEVRGDMLRTAERVLASALARLVAGSPPWRVAVESTIPIAHGMGSSAAFSVALFSALARARGVDLSLSRLNEEAHALEKIVHGTPSGIDSAVITHGQPMWFIKGRPPQPLLQGGLGARLVLASSGEPGSTREAVAAVNARKEAHPDRFQEQLEEARGIARLGREALLACSAKELGSLMNDNHALLQELGVSSHTLDRLVSAALGAGALGAKLTGGGRGGFMMALVGGSQEARVSQALREAGSTLVLCADA